jgi:hypothetical protein
VAIGTANTNVGGEMTDRLQTLFEGMKEEFYFVLAGKIGSSNHVSFDLLANYIKAILDCVEDLL